MNVCVNMNGFVKLFEGLGDHITNTLYKYKSTHLVYGSHRGHQNDIENVS